VWTGRDAADAASSLMKRLRAQPRAGVMDRFALLLSLARREVGSRVATGGLRQEGKKGGGGGGGRRACVSVVSAAREVGCGSARQRATHQSFSLPTTLLGTVMRGGQE